MLTDAHLHLQSPLFDADVDTVVTESQKAGIGAFWCAAETLDDCEKLAALHEKFPQIAVFAGTHPWYAEKHDFKRLERFLTNHPHAQIGETGLDALKGNPYQEKAFEDHLTLGAALNRAVVVHCVKAVQDVIRILKKFPAPPPFLCHAFYGGRNEIAFLADKGGYFSLNARFFTRPDFAERLAFYPPDRVLIETDAPYMRPDASLCVNPQETRNAPQNLVLTFKRLAQLYGIDESALADGLSRNAAAFLKARQ